MAGQTTFSERRENERIALAIPVFVRGTDSEGMEFLEFATALNVSGGGVLLASCRYLPRFSKVVLEVPSTPPSRMVKFPNAVRLLQARILRITPVDGYHLCGLKFLTKVMQAATLGAEVRCPRVKIFSSPR